VGAIAVLAAASVAASARAPAPHHRPPAKQAQKSPPPPAVPAPLPPLPDNISDAEMQKAVPLKQYLHQTRPSTTEEYKSLSGEVAKGKPELDTAKKASDDLARQTAALQKQLVDSAARIENLEREKLTIDAAVERLTADYARLSASFEQDRGTVIRLLAVVQRVNHDNPPAMAVRPDDALGAARAAMLLGAWLPPRYTEAAMLARRIAALKRTRAELTQRRAEATQNAMALTRANADLDRLLGLKRQQADAAAARYGVLKTRLDTIASQAVNLQTLLQKVAQLRAAPGSPSLLTVNAPRGKGWLKPPVVGAYNPGGVDGVGGSTAPGITFATVSGATVVAPADGNVVYAGESGKAGRVLILEIGAGYDVLLAGLDRFDVRSGEAVIAGEPVGVMPKFDHEPRLYFELRPKNGKGMSPAPYLAAALRKAR
jgi:septal ring factor EnvC (AmiA/AmiB activator)